MNKKEQAEIKKLLEEAEECFGVGKNEEGDRKIAVVKARCMFAIAILLGGKR